MDVTVTFMRWVLLPVALWGMLPMGSANEVDRDARIQAALTMRILKFITWPPHAPVSKGGAVRLCTVGHSAVTVALVAQPEAQRANQGVTVQSISNNAPLDVIKTCDAVYSTLINERESDSLMAKLSGLPILTVGSIDNFINSGGIIQLRRFENRFVFDTNLSGAKALGLKISSPLLSLSAQVH
jgi:hypothetical protein